MVSHSVESESQEGPRSGCKQRKLREPCDLRQGPRGDLPPAFFLLVNRCLLCDISPWQTDDQVPVGAGGEKCGADAPPAAQSWFRSGPGPCKEGGEWVCVQGWSLLPEPSGPSPLARLPRSLCSSALCCGSPVCCISLNRIGEAKAG